MVYHISYNTLIGAEPLRIRFDKIDGFIRVYDGTRYLVLFGFENYGAIYDKIRYLISQKSAAASPPISHNCTRIKINVHDFLPPEKTLNSLDKFLIKIKISTIIIYS